MRIEKRDGTEARLVLTRMCLDGAVLGSVAARDDPRPFGSKAENLISGWAIQHWRKHHQPPGKMIAVYFERWAESKKDDAVEDYVASFLEAISDEAKRNGSALASAVALEMAGRVFDKVQLERVREEIDAKIQAGDVDGAAEAVSKFRRSAITAAAPLDFYAGGEAEIADALENKDELLVEWDQQAMKVFFDLALSRGEFIILMGRAKVGKSFWLQAIARQAVMCKCNVAFFELGDQTKRQMKRRLYARESGRPVRSREWPKPVPWPVEITPDPDGKTPHVEHETRTFDRPPTPKEVDASLAAFEKKYGRGRFKLSVHSNRTMTVPKIENLLDDWARDKWYPDVVVMDYIDLCAPMSGGSETRDQINETWMAARRMVQDRDILLVTSTQSNREGYDAHTLDMGNASEDRHKNDHCTGMVTINQTRQEKAAGLHRLEWTYHRDLDFPPGTAVYAAGCLAAADPCVLSCF